MIPDEGVAVDAHVHLWRLARGDNVALSPAMTPIYRDLEPPDLKPRLDAAGVARIVVVQAAETLAEALFLLGLARKFSWISGIIAWVEPGSPAIEEEVAALSWNSCVKGVRPIRDDNRSIAWMLDARLDRGWQALSTAGLSLDILVQNWRELPIATELARLERYQREGAAGGLEIDLLDANEVRRRFPYVGPDVCAATWSKRDGTANPRLATPAVARAARALGAEIWQGTRVTRVEFAGERLRVVTDREFVVEAPYVVNASGAWGNEIAEQFGETTPMFEAAPPNFVTEPLPYFITPALQDAGGSVIIRQVERGNVIVGFYPRGPADRVRNRAPVAPEKTLQSLGDAIRVVPILRGAQAIRVWSGIEGYLPDMLPVMGWSHTTKNLLHAYGFCGHGFQLSPGVGYTLAEMIDEGNPRIPIDAFSISRFTGEVHPDAERLTGEFDAALASAAMRPRTESLQR